MSDLLTTPELSTKRAIEPAKRWRNKYRNHGDWFRTRAGGQCPPGEFWGELIFPSRDMAETRAKWLQSMSGSPRWALCEWIDAFPEDAP